MRQAMVKYQSLVGDNHDLLRRLIPCYEVWRFFVEEHAQKKGRGLRLLFELLNAVPDHSNLTVKDYIETIEGISFSEKEVSKFWKLLQDHNWTLTDEQSSHFTLNDLLTLDRGWMPFEINEPGCLKAFYRAFNVIFDTSQTLDVQFIKRLHHLAGNEVQGINYHHPDYKIRGNIGDFRQITAMKLGLLKTNASRKGLIEFFEENHPNRFLILEIISNNTIIGHLKINLTSVQLIRNYIKRQPTIQKGMVLISDEFDFLEYFDGDHDNIEMLFNMFQTDPYLSHLLISIGKSQTNDELANCIYYYIEHPVNSFSISFLSHQPGNAGPDIVKQLDIEVSGYINEYEKLSSKSSSWLEKVKAIDWFVHQFETCHPFLDLNVRVSALLVLHLLYREKMPLSIVDANIFNYYSAKQRVKSIIEGMNHFAELIKTKQLFGFCSEDFLIFLQGDRKFCGFLTYFNECTLIEEDSRKEQPQLSYSSSLKTFS